jgi:hypothetical protein
MYSPRAKPRRRARTTVAHASSRTSRRRVCSQVSSPSGRPAGSSHRRPSRLRFEHHRLDTDIGQLLGDVLGGLAFTGAATVAVVRGIDTEQVTAQVDDFAVRFAHVPILPPSRRSVHPGVRTDAKILCMKANHLDWPDLYNARDLGGLPTLDGGTILPAALIRSDQHSRLTGEGIAAVRTAGVSRILDLRHPRECEAKPNPCQGEPLYRNVSVEDPAGPNDQDGMSLAEIYCLILDSRQDLFATAV